MPQIYSRCCDEFDTRNETAPKSVSNVFAALECGIGVAPTLCNDTSLNTQWSLNVRNASQIYSYHEFHLRSKNYQKKYVWIKEMPSLFFSKLPMNWYEFIRAKVLKHDFVDCRPDTNNDAKHNKYGNRGPKRVECKEKQKDWKEPILLDPIQYLL